MRARTRPAAASLVARLCANPTAVQIDQAGLTNLRRLSLLLALCLAWSFAVAPVALSATPQAQAPRPAPVRPFTSAQIRQTLDEIEAVRARSAAVPTILRPDLRPARPHPAALAQARPRSLSLLDQVGRLAHPLDPAAVAAWKAELRAGPQAAPRHPASADPASAAGVRRPPARLCAPPAGVGPRAAVLHLWLGEAALARDEQPRLARWHFRQVERLTKPSGELYGRAAYDSVMALFYEGAYQDAAAQFRHLLVHGRGLRGFERRDCTLWLRHAAACAGYHDQHARLGIPEPPQLDPLCGAAALAAGLRALGRPSDRGTLLRACRVTGEGSTLADLVAAGPRLGVSVRALTADDRGLVALPKPLVAYVEQDHFVAVVGADAKGVSYLCSDCGPWPGGRVDLTWRQWHALSPGTYAAVLARGGAWDSTLAALGRLASAPNAAPVRVSAVGSLASLGLSVRAHLGLALPALAGHVVMTHHPGPTGCGIKPPALPCKPMVKCPPLCRKGDPVNLATGEEEYRSEPDLTVYNPLGPSVTWQREYRSLRGPGQDGTALLDTTYQSDDFGVGWSQSYNIGVYDPNVRTRPQPQTLAPGGFIEVPETGSDSPSDGYWDILLNGTVIASSSNPNGWGADYSGGPGQPLLHDVYAPAGAAASSNYEVREYFGSSASFTVNPGYYDVSVGGEQQVFPNGTDAPTAGLSWDVAHGGTTVASSAQPNGWNVTNSSVADGGFNSSSPLTLDVPFSAAAGPGYEVRAQIPGYGTFSALIALVPGQAAPGAGTKYVVFPNGSRVAFTAPQAPSAGTPAVSCAVEPGAPYLVEWDYDAGDAGGHYTVTTADRTKWVTAGADPQTLCYALGRIVDRSGNALTFHYGPQATVGYDATNGTLGNTTQWPLLASITNGAGTALLTVTRATDGTGNVTQVSDCYGRSVYYNVGNYSNSNVPSSLATSYQEVDHVSQVVATGTASAPVRWAYGYQNVSNTEGSEHVEFLTTITAPSPTGGGNAVTAIQYDSGTDLVQSVSDADGGTATLASTDAAGSPSYPSDYTTVTVTGGGMTPYTYTAGFDSNMSETSETDGAGHAVSTVNAFSASDPYEPAQSQDGNGNATSNVYDPFGNLLRTTSPRGTVTNYAYAYPAAVYPLVQGLPNTQERDGAFGLGELVGAQEGGKTPTSYAYYEPSGLVQTVTGPRPGTNNAAAIVLASYAYDGLGNVTSVTRPGPNSAAGNTSTYVTTAMGYTSDGGYTQADALGQPLTVTDPLGHTTHLRYDARGNTTAAIDAAGNETDSTFNLDDRPLSTIYPATGQNGGGRGSTLSTYLYNGPGPGEQYGPLVNVQTFDEGSTAGAFRTVSYSYDQAGQTTGVSGGTEPVTYTYDGQYRLTSLTDGAGHATHYFYNAQGYLYQVAYPGAGVPGSPLAAGTPDTVTYTGYDGNGDVTQRVDGNGTTTTYTYQDPESLLTRIHYAPGSGVASLADTTYSYDAYGRRATTTDATGGQGYTYGDDDRLTADTTTYAGLPARTVSYAFDPDGSRATMSTPAGGFSYSYDNAGRETALTNPAGQSFAWAYYDNDWLRSQSLPGGVTTTDAYDARGQVTDRLTAQNGSGMTEFGAVRYDGAGDRTAVYCAVPGAPYDGAAASQYDAKSQLTGEQRSSSTGYAFSHAYDGAGNPTTYRNNAVGAASADNQLPGVPYDGDGAPTTCKGTTVTYDPEGRAVNFYGLVASAYTGDGLRGVKYAGGYTYFLYDGDRPVCELSSSGAVTAVHTFGPAGLLARGFGTNGSSGTFFYTWDLSGNLARRLDVNGNILASAMSDGFGAVSSTDNSPDPFSGFGGQWGGYTDAAQAGQTGLTLFTHRFYDPSTGRFLTRDPMGYTGGVNLYAYTQNDPTNRNDPEGTTYALPFPITLPTLGDIWTGIKTGLGGIADGLGGPAAGTIGLAGVLTLGLATPAGPVNEFPPGRYPGFPVIPVKVPDNPAEPPGPGWVWQGNGPAGSKAGNWVNPGTGERLHPDLNHGSKPPKPKGPHWGYRPAKGCPWQDIPPGGDTDNYGPGY